MSTTAFGFFILVLCSILFSTLTTVYCGGHFVLERIGSKNMEHSKVIARDLARHDHHRGPAVNFPIGGGTSAGLYFTRVKIGNPSKEYHLVIDTGSDVTWVSCNPCVGCPNTSDVIQLNSFDPHTSSSAETLTCSDHCMSLPYTRISSCPLSDSLCNYSMYYGDGTMASGYYVSDAFHFDTMMGNSTGVNTTSANVVFGCTNNQHGTLAKPKTALDGILGLAPRQLSFISQMHSRGVVPNMFSHCLNVEDKGGGGILVLGEFVGPNITYTPLVPNQTYYNVNLLGISINGQTLPIDPLVFSISRNGHGTVVDSGTTYAFLPEEAYDSFINAVVATVPPSVSSVSWPESHCFHVSNSVRDVFPQVSLDFAGGASMILKPEVYLVQHPNTTGVWCIGFQKSQGLTILGDLVLKDKIIVYDLELQRLGWAEYDCSSFVNVSLVSPRVSSSPRDAILHQFLTGTEDHQVLVIQQGSLPSSSDAQVVIEAMSAEFESDISIDGIVEALSSIGSDKAPGPDDLLAFFHGDVASATTLAEILQSLKGSTVHEVNYTKSSLFPAGVSHYTVEEIKQELGFQEAAFPEFHVGCLKDHKMEVIRGSPKGEWFYCTDDSKIHSVLPKLLVRGSPKLPDSLLSIIKKKHVEEGSNNYTVLDKRFDPVVDSGTGCDLIPLMVYGVERVSGTKIVEECIVQY